MSKESGFRLLEHTADMGIAARAPSLKDVFIESARGLRTLMLGNSPAESAQQQQVELHCDNEAELLVAWLNEIIYLFETKGLVPASFQIELIEQSHLKGVIEGEEFNPARHNVERQAKAATYHQLELSQTDHGWTARIFIDL